LFVTPQYDSALIEQSLLLNRRRNEKEHLKRKLEEHFEELDIVDGMASLGKILIASFVLFVCYVSQAKNI
jgi:hypothetical protein